jgi:hypothetical protein
MRAGLPKGIRPLKALQKWKISLKKGFFQLKKSTPTLSKRNIISDSIPFLLFVFFHPVDYKRCF